MYEGLKATAELEYDVMFIMKGDKFFSQHCGGGKDNDFPCHFKLVQNPKKRQRSLLNNLLVSHQVKGKGGEKMDELVLSPAKVIQKFESVVHKYTNSLKERKMKMEIDLFWEAFKQKKTGCFLSVQCLVVTQQHQLE